MTVAATGTQQYLWGSSHATSECGLVTIFFSNAALQAVNSGERTASGQYSPCGHQCTLHPHMILMASSAVVYSAPHTVVDLCAGTPPPFPAPLPHLGAARW